MEKRSEVRVTKTPSKKPTTLGEFQQEKITRREALRRIGITTGAGLFMMFGVDDLARLASRKLAEHKEFGEVGETVAKEFREAGVAFAGGPSGCSGYSGSPSNPSIIIDNPCNGSSPPKYCTCKQPGRSESDCQKCCDDRYAGQNNLLSPCYQNCGGL